MDFLVVDDDRLICEGIVRRLQEMADVLEIGQIHARYSGEDALAMLAHTPVDILITDIRMYELDGLKLIAKAKALSQRMGFIIVTAYHELEYAQQAIRMGVDDFLLKPYSMQAMRETVGRVVARLSAQRGLAKRQLDLALLMGMTRSEASAHALFAEHGAACPAGPLQLAMWEASSGDLPAPPAGLWQYAIAEEGCMLVWHEEGRAAELGRWLSACAAELHASVGISLPGDSLMMMAEQARAARAQAWLWKAPRAIPFAQPEEARGDAQCKLIRHLRTLHLQSAREQLAVLITDGHLRAPQQAVALYETLYDTLLQICREYELDIPAVDRRPAPYLGMEQAFGRLLGAAEEAVAAMGHEASVRPIAWAKRYARDHYHEAIDMADIARKLKMSYTYFSKLFKEQTGKTFSEYLLDLRIHEAQRLLMRGMKVADVAQQVGYTSIYNFTRAFTKACGIAPVKWRRETTHSAGDAE